uniref:Protein AMBP n=1 Tax=Myripristis murdjan TaxID=586833 RepID=A0A667ZV96_9TELE
MQKGLNLVSLLVLGWAWTLQGLPVLPEPLYPTQENFDLTRFLGKWHDVAVASTCPYMQSHRGDAAIGSLELESGSTNSTIKMTRIVLRHGVCKEISGDYQLTTTPGRFFYHIEKWGADVDAYVVHTNYDEYAIVIMNKKKTSGTKSTSVKLYSRTMDVRDTVLDDFKTLVRQQEMSEDTIIIKKNKGNTHTHTHARKCSAAPRDQAKRNVVPSLAPTDMEGSGDLLVFREPDACKAQPDTGPCFGMKDRYFYNSTAMACMIFKYGGCLGNQNNFHTERECLQTCRTEAVCRLPMAAHACTGEPPIWAFDSSAGLCVAYKQGFCQGNGNKFYTKAECEEYCGVAKEGESKR